MGRVTQTHVYHWGDGWIPFIREWLTVPSLPYWPLGFLYLTHTFPFAHPHSIFVSSVICICPLPCVLWSISLSLLRKSDLLASIWHCTHLNVYLSVILSLPRYQRSHLHFIMGHIGRAKEACLVMAAVALDGDKRETYLSNYHFWLMLGKLHVCVYVGVQFNTRH